MEDESKYYQKQILKKRLAIVLAKVQAGNTSENLTNEIWHFRHVNCMEQNKFKNKYAIN